MLGPPSVSCVDIHTWGTGCRPLQDLVVREAKTRLTVMAAVGKGTLAIAFCLPAVREDDARGLSSMETRWLDRISARTSPLTF